MFTLHLGDSTQFLRSLPDKSIDNVFADFPYGNETDYEIYKDTQENLVKLVNDIMPQALRVAKRVIVTSGVTNAWLYPQPTWVLAWIAEGNANSSAWGFQCWQPILVYGDDPYLKSGKGRRPDIIKYQDNKFKNHNSQIAHPCPKPIGLMNRILARTTLEGETVLDPFMGSGSTGIACVQSNRVFIGCELNPKYYSVAKERIEKAAAQSDMFSTPPNNRLQRTAGMHPLDGDLLTPGLFPAQEG